MARRADQFTSIFGTRTPPRTAATLGATGARVLADLRRRGQLSPKRRIGPKKPTPDEAAKTERASVDRDDGDLAGVDPRAVKQASLESVHYGLVARTADQSGTISPPMPPPTPGPSSMLPP